MNLRSIAAALAVALVLPLSACQTPPPGEAPPINKTAVAIQQSAAVAMNGATIAVQTCVLDKAAPVGAQMDVAFRGLVATLDDMSDAVEAGETDSANLLIGTAQSALTQVQIALNSLKPTPAQDGAIKARTAPATKANLNEIIAMVQQFLPIVVSGGTTIATLVNSLIQNIDAPNADVGIDDVQQANAAMQAALSAWAAATCVK